jgi:hypothetical protein
MLMYQQAVAAAAGAAAAAGGGGDSSKPSAAAVVFANLVKQAGRLCQLLSAAAPSRHTCNGPLCRSLGAVSERFGLVRGRACVCGCCVARTAGGRSRELAAR